MDAIYAARKAENPAAAPVPGPWVDKPGALIAAEREVFRGEMAERLQRAMCGEAARCKDHRRRRRGRCRALEDIAPELERARANLAAERAKWQPAPADSPCGHKKGRAGP